MVRNIPVAQAISEVIRSATDTNVISSVTDSRQMSVSETQSKTLLGYEVPKINSFGVSRCNADGSANDEGEYAKVSYNIEITALNII